MHLGARAGFAAGKKPDAKRPGTALVIPKPINLPSRRKENNGFDPSIQLVPASSAGSAGWMGSGARPVTATPAGTTAGGYLGQQLGARPGTAPGNTSAGGRLPVGWGAAAPGNSNAGASSGAGREASGGDFPELGGPSKPTNNNPWKAPNVATSEDDSRGRFGGDGSAPRRPYGEGWGGNGRDWAEDEEEEPMDFRRPVATEKDPASNGAISASNTSSTNALPASSVTSAQSANAIQRVDPREEARMLALKKQQDLEKMAEQFHAQQQEASEQLLRKEREEQERRQKEMEEHRMAQEEARRRAMEQAEERRRAEQERRAYEEQERTWQDEQRRFVEEQRRQQQNQYRAHEDVITRPQTQEQTMRQATEAAKLRRLEKEEREREREHAARIKVEELDRRRGERVGPSSLGGDAILRPGGGGQSWSSWGDAALSTSGPVSSVGFGGVSQEVDYSSMTRGRVADPKGPRKLFDHKAGKFVSEDEAAWKGINRPPNADKGAVKGSEKPNIASAGSRDARSGVQLAGSLSVSGGGKEPEGMSRAELKKLALEERRRREREGKSHVDEESDVLGTTDCKSGDKNQPKRLLTRDHEKGAQGNGGAAARQTMQTGIFSVDSAPNIQAGNWMSGLSGGLRSDELDASWALSHDTFGGDLLNSQFGMFKMEDTNDVATGAADFILDGDDEGLCDGGDDALLEHSFNAPVGWAPASSRAGWGGETSSVSGAWDTNALGQGSSVNIEKAFGAFNGVGNNSVLGGLASSFPTSQSNLVWSGSMMPMSFDVTSDWQLQNDDTAHRTSGLPQGWAAPPPDSFQPAGDTDSGSRQTVRQDRSEGMGAKGRVKPKQQREPRETREPRGRGAGQGHKNRGQAADVSSSAELFIVKVAENDADTQSESLGRGGRGARSQSANAARREAQRSNKGGKPQVPTDVLAGVDMSAAVSISAPKEQSGGGVKSARGNARGAAKIVAVPANIRMAAQEHMVKQREAAFRPAGDQFN